MSSWRETVEGSIPVSPSDKKGPTADLLAELRGLDKKEAIRLLVEHVRRCPAFCTQLQLKRAVGFSETLDRALDADAARQGGGYPATHRALRAIEKAVKAKERVPEAIDAYQRIARRLVREANDYGLSVTDHYKTRELFWKIEAFHLAACHTEPPPAEQLTDFLCAMSWNLPDGVYDYASFLDEEQLNRIRKARS